MVPHIAVDKTHQRLCDFSFATHDIKEAWRDRLDRGNAST